ncbi:MAG TPA: TonB-dependent receptor [Vitreimonas sp.]|uniref:TonB-dependent receptor n=1 Tax=Vitreimonas sp. TaxID=3069702 RepID=UPI002D5EA978|nr:TonB-dependent receptor [Vitreimonas sp.]HYD86133.1 TonB-dependent receptor [Vitreimonas sp.]
MFRFALALLASASALPLTAHAQEVADSEEIVVTAQKREERLRDVPQSVTAITDETLERLQANDFSDYAGHVPGLAVTGGQPGNSRVTLRGLNTGGVASTVGIYVDETPFGSSTSLVNAAALALDLDPFDVQRIEVLRGPQGTLYGANTLGGLIKFVTTAPAPGEFFGRASGAVETTEGGESSWSTRAMVNVPLGDQAALRVSGLRRSEGGYIDDPSRGVEDVNGVETTGWRAAFLLNATDNLTIRLSAQSQDIDSDATEAVAYFQDPLEPVAGETDQFSPFAVSSDVSYRILNGTIDWDLGWASLISSTSYSELEQHHLEDGTLAFGLPSFLVEDIPQDKTTQEVRLASNGDGPLEWLVGAFYTRENGLLDQEIFFGTPPGAVSGLTASIDSEYEERAIFGGVTYHFSPQFDVAVGARYAENEQSMNQGGTAVSTGSEESSDDAITYSVAPRWRLNDRTMLYARVATGYRPGGPNILGAPSVIPTTFDPDQTINYEIGVKTDLVDGLLRVDAAAFHIEWSDIQLLVFDGAVSGNANGGGAESQGVEWTTTLTPSDALTVVWSGAYTNTQLTDDTDPIVVGGQDGDPLPYAPEWASTVDVSYEWTVFGNADAHLGGAWRYVGEQSTGFPGVGGFLYGAEQIELPSYNLLDLRAGVDFETFSLELFAKNVTDERAVTQFGGFGETLPDNVGLPNGAAVLVRPRTIGVSLTANF